jgi:hypothetical protein
MGSISRFTAITTTHQSEVGDEMRPSKIFYTVGPLSLPSAVARPYRTNDFILAAKESTELASGGLNTIISSVSRGDFKTIL